jgi:hypothetical protein
MRVRPSDIGFEQMLGFRCATARSVYMVRRSHKFHRLAPTLERPPQELDRKYELFESIAMVQKTSEQQRAWSS